MMVTNQLIWFRFSLNTVLSLIPSPPEEVPSESSDDPHFFPNLKPDLPPLNFPSQLPIPSSSEGVPYTVGPIQIPPSPEGVPCSSSFLEGINNQSSSSPEGADNFESPS